MKEDVVPAAHVHGYRESEPNHQRSKGGSKPTESAMHAHLVHSHQCRLRDEEQHPGREYRAVHPEEQRPGRLGMEEIRIDCVAEAPHDQSGQDQRHGEIEVAAQEPFERGRRSGFFLKTRSEPHISHGHELSFECPSTLSATARKKSGTQGLPCSIQNAKRLFGGPRGKAVAVH